MRASLLPDARRPSCPHRATRPTSPTKIEEDIAESGDHIRPHYQYPHHLCSIVALPSERPFLWKRSWTAKNLHMLKDQIERPDYDAEITHHKEERWRPTREVGLMGLIIAEKS
jgi:hypothetical protein